MRRGCDNALEYYELPSFEELLPASFRDRFGINPGGQYGVACSSVAAECAAAEALGAGPFIGGKLGAPNWVEFGKPRKCKLEVALGYEEDQQIEFLGPGTGTSFYFEALGEKDHVLHHVGVFQNGSDEMERVMNDAGFETAVSGGVRFGNALGFEFKYFDTRDELGFYLEFLDFHYMGGKAIDIRKPIELMAGLKGKLKGR